MKSLYSFAFRHFHRTALALLAAYGTMSLMGCGPVSTITPPTSQAQAARAGLVNDWTSHHVIFTNPGTEQEAIAAGKHAEWKNLVNDPRYVMQETRRNTGWQWLGLDGSPFPLQGGKPVMPVKDRHAVGLDDSSQGDWGVTLTTATLPTVIPLYPAKFSFAPIVSPSCTQDYVVYPVPVAGSTTQANLVGVNNLYKGFCTTGTVPNVQFAYHVGNGVVRTSPVLSLDGTKIAFVETITNGSILHILKIGTTGSNGTAWNTPVVPGTGNNAVDTKFTLNGGVTDTFSAPYIDYDDDVAFVGDSTGKLHMFTNVFGVYGGTPAEVTTGGWPFTVSAGGTLLSAAFDYSISKRIFVVSGSSIFCVAYNPATITPPALCSTPSISAGGGLQLPPILDVTNQTLFAFDQTSGQSYVFQTNTSFSTSVKANTGLTTNGLYNGTFDQAYYNVGPGSGHVYSCGGNPTTGTGSSIYRVGFTGSVLNSANDGNRFQLAPTTGGPGNPDCSPLNEVYNGTTDMLFVNVRDGASASTCGGQGCTLSFNVTAGFPSSAAAARQDGTQNIGVGAMIVDTVSTTVTATGAAQIYFVNMNTGLGVQVSQSALQ